MGHMQSGCQVDSFVPCLPDRYSFERRYYKKGAEVQGHNKMYSNVQTYRMPHVKADTATLLLG